jgi:hypothetical protein
MVPKVLNSIILSMVFMLVISKPASLRAQSLPPVKVVCDTTDDPLTLTMGPKIDVQYPDIPFPPNHQ